MSYTITQALSAGVMVTVSLNQPVNVQAVRLSNSSPFDLTYDGVGTNGTEIIPAGMEYMLLASVHNPGECIILPVNNYGTVGSGICNLTVYLVGDQLPQGNWPATIPVQTVTLGQATTIVNDGNTAGTNIIESTVSGDSSSCVIITNDGRIVIGTVTHPGSLSISNGQFTIDNLGNLTAVGVITFDQTGNQKILAHSGGVLIDASAGTDIRINAPNTGGGHKLYLQVGGNDELSVDGSGNVRCRGTLTQNVVP